MKAEDYAQGDAFQAEKRTIFATEWLPVCAEPQLATPGDFQAATVGGWSVVAVHAMDGELRVLRNACRHQNMPVVGTPAGNCESFRCRFHGWTYDLAGRFLAAPPPVAPAGPHSVAHDLQALAVARAAGMVFFSLGSAAAAPRLGTLPPYGGTIATDIACNWKVCVEHILQERRSGSPEFTWHWPLLALRHAGDWAIIEQVVPHTFLRTRLLTHTFGTPADDQRQAAATLQHACELLQAERLAGTPPQDDNDLVRQFHGRLAAAYAGSS